MVVGRIAAASNAAVCAGFMAVACWTSPLDARAYSAGLEAGQGRNAVGSDDSDLFMIFFDKNKLISRQGSVVIAPTGSQDYAIIAYDEHTREVGRVYGEAGLPARLVLDLPIGKSKLFYLRVVVKGSRFDSEPGSGFKRAALTAGQATHILPPYAISVEEGDGSGMPYNASQATGSPRVAAAGGQPDRAWRITSNVNIVQLP